MKKYSVFSLYVVEVLHGYDVHYLICKHKKENTYIEVFTNSKIKIENDLFVEPLSNYYSLLTVCNYSTGKPLMLDKKLLLNKYRSINTLAGMERGKAVVDDDCSIDANKLNEILEEATLNFFPKDGSFENNYFYCSNDLYMMNLPSNLDDDIWLAKMLKQKQKLLYISINDILQYVKTSSLFDEKKHEYKQKIVKWQIEKMLIMKYENVDMYTSMCDLNFRDSVIKILSDVGINTEAIEEGIEKNSDMWRDCFMNKAFINEYEALGYTSCELMNPLNLELLELKDKWMKVRKYEYYQNHKASVDKYGVVEPDMNLSEEEIISLKSYLREYTNKRKEKVK